MQPLRLAGRGDVQSGRVVLGIDEAGRGPILGPMVVAGVVLPVEALPALRAAGVRDSKELDARARRRLAEEIARISPHLIIVEVPPETIDSVNLNVLERDTFAAILARALTVWGDRLVRVTVDAVGDPKAIAATLRRTGFAGEIVAEKKADAKYVEVSAASIVAKVARDAAIEELRRRYGVRGSGYPTDPETLEWIREAYARSPDEPPPFVRRTWGTLRRLAPRWYVEKRVKPSRLHSQRSLLDYIPGLGYGHTHHRRSRG